MRTAEKALENAGYVVLEKGSRNSAFSIDFQGPNGLKMEGYQSETLKDANETTRTVSEIANTLQSRGNIVIENNVTDTSFIIKCLSVGTPESDVKGFGGPGGPHGGPGGFHGGPGGPGGFHGGPGGPGGFHGGPGGFHGGPGGGFPIPIPIPVPWPQQGGCNVFGCWNAGGGCNPFGCWNFGGGCNAFGCW